MTSKPGELDGSAAPPAPLDDVDRAIVEVLREDGRISMRALAARLHISRAGAYLRVQRLEEAGVICRRVNKVREGRPHVVDMIKNDEVALIVNTTEGKQAVRESRSIRREAVARKVTYYTTVAGARATCDALDHLGDIEVNRLQDLHKEMLA